MNQPLAKFLPHNAQEFENEMRALIVSHMGLGEGNPTGWVVKAVCEAYQRGFGVGFAAGQYATVSAPPPFKVEIPPGNRLYRQEPAADVVDVQARQLPYTKE